MSDIKDTWDQAARQARKVGKQVEEAFTGDDVKDIGKTIGQLTEDLADEAVRMARSKEVEAAVDSVGSIFKGLASKIHEAREKAESQPGRSTEPEDPAGDKAV